MQYRCQWKKVLLTLSWFPFSQHSCIHPAKVSFSVCFIVAKTHNMRSILLTKLCLKYSIVNYKHNDGAKVRFLNWPLYSIACDKIHLLWKKLPFLLSQKTKVIQESKSQHGSSYQATAWIIFTDALLPKSSYTPKSQNQCGRGLQKRV